MAVCRRAGHTNNMLKRRGQERVWECERHEMEGRAGEIISASLARGSVRKQKHAVWRKLLVFPVWSIAIVTNSYCALAIPAHFLRADRHQAQGD